jgi:hypothetical protein
MNNNDPYFSKTDRRTDSCQGHSDNELRFPDDLVLTISDDLPRVYEGDIPGAFNPFEQVPDATKLIIDWP